MKAYYKLLIVPLLIATACSPSYVGTSAFQDDIYFVPGEESLIDKEMAVYTTHADKKEPTIEQTTRVEPTTKATFGDDRDFQQIQEQYREMLASDSIGTIDTTYYNDEQGYFIGEFNGTDSDLDDIERLRQWYPQGFGYYDNSGYNLAMWLANDPDWNVYVDGDKVWWTPTWTNFNHYNSYNFSPIRYGRHFAYNSHNYGSNFGFGFGFGIGHGFYDDFYWGSSFGWGYPYYNNYSHYGYGYPYYGYNNYHNYGGHYGYAKQSKNYYGSRRTMGSNVGTSRAYTNRSAVSKTQGTTNRINRSAGYKSGTTNRINRSAGYTKSGTTTRRSAATAKDAVRRSTAAQRYGNRNSRSSYGNRAGTTTRRVNTTGTTRRSNYKGTTTRYGTQNRSTYRGTKSGTTVKRRPSNYTKPRSNSRPSYNKSGTRRSTNMRSTGTRSSKYSKVRSTPTYRKSSTRSSRSSSRSYRPSRSSSSRSSGAVRSSGSSSRSSGAVRSSGSSSRSSSGSSRSSGGSRRR
jgi:hypothetical protein